MENLYVKKRITWINNNNNNNNGGGFGKIE